MRLFVSLHLTGQLLDPVGDTVEPACEDAKQTGQGCEEKGGCQGSLNDMCDVVERSEQSGLPEPGRSSKKLPRNNHRGQSDREALINSSSSREKAEADSAQLSYLYL